MSVLFKHTENSIFPLTNLTLASASTALVTGHCVGSVTGRQSEASVNSPSARSGARLGHGMWAFPLLFWKGTIIDHTKTFHLPSHCCILCLSAGHGGLSDTEMLFLYWRRFFQLKVFSFPLIFFLTLKNILSLFYPNHVSTCVS